MTGESKAKDGDEDAGDGGGGGGGVLDAEASGGTDGAKTVISAKSGGCEGGGGNPHLDQKTQPIKNGAGLAQVKSLKDDAALNSHAKAGALPVTKRRSTESSNLAALRRRHRGGGSVVGGGFFSGANRFNGEGVIGAGNNNNNNNNAGNASMILPHKFHLGGNISDPLNLNGLINRPVGGGATTPPSDSPAALRSSPVKKQQRDQLPVNDAPVTRLPCNPNDPLNLNVPDKDITEEEMLLPGADDADVATTTGMAKAKKRKRKGSTSMAAEGDSPAEEDNDNSASAQSDAATTSASNQTLSTRGNEAPSSLAAAAPIKKLKVAPNLNKIVSPAIPQGVKPRHNSTTNQNHHAALGRKKSAKSETNCDNGGLVQNRNNKGQNNNNGSGGDVGIVNTCGNNNGNKNGNNNGNNNGNTNGNKNNQSTGGNKSADRESSTVAVNNSDKDDFDQKEPNSNSDDGFPMSKKQRKRKRRLSLKSNATKSSNESGSKQQQQQQPHQQRPVIAPSTSTSTSGGRDFNGKGGGGSGGGGGGGASGIPKKQDVDKKNNRKVFDHGNYDQYYGHRNPGGDDDHRFQLFDRSWFVDAEVLDIGCNIGHVTLTLARDFGPKRVVGIDIDAQLVAIARKNVKHYLVDVTQSSKFGPGLAKMFGPLARDLKTFNTATTTTTTTKAFDATRKMGGEESYLAHVVVSSEEEKHSATCKGIEISDDKKETRATQEIDASKREGHCQSKNVDDSLGEKKESVISTYGSETVRNDSSTTNASDDRNGVSGSEAKVEVKMENVSTAGDEVPKTDDAAGETMDDDDHASCIDVRKGEGKQESISKEGMNETAIEHPNNSILSNSDIKPNLAEKCETSDNLGTSAEDSPIDNKPNLTEEGITSDNLGISVKELPIDTKPNLAEGKTNDNLGISAGELPVDKRSSSPDPGVKPSSVVSPSATSTNSPSSQRPSLFPKNVSFVQCDFVLEADALLETVKPEYDVILALSVTKWVHLNGGDEAIKRFFKRVFLSLRPGGKFILEPQPWSSYKKKKNLTPKIAEIFAGIQFKPDRFRPFLLSEEVGFKSVRFLGDCKNKSKGFHRSVLLLEK